MKIFWAWQSDLRAAIARTFIREALQEAIKEINQTEDIEEPDEKFQSGLLQLDFGREGLKGSPDLAIEIMKKIDNATVFVCDVTPVGKTEPQKNDEGKEASKLLMNPNVAIELGYALKSLGTENVLMIMNSEFGKRADMPFDLGHKGGPITYSLAANAKKDEIEKQKRQLVRVLVDALKLYVPKPPVVPFEALQPQIGHGIFFKNGEVLGQTKHPFHNVVTNYGMPFRRVMWLRVMPTTPLRMSVAVDTLMQNVSRYGAFGSPAGMEFVTQNAYGIAYMLQAGATDNIAYLTQYTRKGEVWGINSDILRQGERGETFDFLVDAFEQRYIGSLKLYCQYVQDVLKIDPPIQVEAGVEGIAGAKLRHTGVAFSLGGGAVMDDDRVEHRDYLKSFDDAEQRRFLLEFFKKVHANTGVPRPEGKNGLG